MTKENRVRAATRGQVYGTIQRNPGYRGKWGEAEVDAVNWLEKRGLILFVPGVGWVDSRPAIRRAHETAIEDGRPDWDGSIASLFAQD